MAWHRTQHCAVVVDVARRIVARSVGCFASLESAALCRKHVGVDVHFPTARATVANHFGANGWRAAIWRIVAEYRDWDHGKQYLSVQSW